MTYYFRGDEVKNPPFDMVSIAGSVLGWGLGYAALMIAKNHGAAMLPMATAMEIISVLVIGAATVGMCLSGRFIAYVVSLSSLAAYFIFLASKMAMLGEIAARGVIPQF